MHSNAPDTTLHTLQIGRALAALMVGIQHSTLAIKSAFPDMPDIFFQLGNLGYFGVDYFFVLSGFIIAHTTQNMRPCAADGLRYTVARLLRIYPPYFPIGIAMLLALTLFPHLSAREQSDISIVGSLFLLPSNAPTALSIAWTLQHEIVFYAAFGLCFFCFKSRYLIFLWALPILTLSNAPMPHWAYILVTPINLEFLLGIAAYHAYRRGLFFNSRHLLLMLGIGLLCTTSVLSIADMGMPYERLWFGLSFSIIVLAMTLIEHPTVAHTPDSGLPSQPGVDFSRHTFLLYLGTASYSLYLVSGVTNSLLLRVIHHLPHWSLAYLILVPISFLAGIAYYRLVEKPLISYTKKWHQRRDWRGGNEHGCRK